MKDTPYTLGEVYREWYKQRTSDSWDDFNAWFETSVAPKRLFNVTGLKYIKEALIMTDRNLEDQVQDWRKEWQILVLAKEVTIAWTRKHKFKL